MSRIIWRVTIGEADGLGGSNPVKYRFDDYDDAHAFYVYIKSLVGTSFHPYVLEPPTKKELKSSVIERGCWPQNWKKKP